MHVANHWLSIIIDINVNEAEKRDLKLVAKSRLNLTEVYNAVISIAYCAVAICRGYVKQINQCVPAKHFYLKWLKL